MRYIRSYDFESTRDCFIEGIVVNEDRDSGMYTVLTMKKVFSNEIEDIMVGQDTFRTPMEGRLIFDYDGRIEDLENPSWENSVGVALDCYLAEEAA